MSTFNRNLKMMIEVIRDYEKENGFTPSIISDMDYDEIKSYYYWIIQ